MIEQSFDKFIERRLYNMGDQLFEIFLKDLLNNDIEIDCEFTTYGVVYCIVNEANVMVRGIAILRYCGGDQTSAIVADAADRAEEAYKKLRNF